MPQVKQAPKTPEEPPTATVVEQLPNGEPTAPPAAVDNGEAAAPASPPSTLKAKGKQKPPQELRYPDYQVAECFGDDGLTEEQVKILLGYDDGGEEKTYTESIPDGLQQLFGKNVILRNDLNNRPLDVTITRTYGQAYLQRQWKRNNAAIGIGQYGNIMDGQKRMIGFLWACTRLRSEREKELWAKVWPDPAQFRLESIVVYGMEETQDVRQTIDNTQARSFADTLYTDPTFQPKAKGSDRVRLCRMYEFATRFVWNRVGVKRAFRLNVTPAEYNDFRDRHPKLEAAVKHIDEENQGSERGVAKWVSPGYAAGLLYLMAASASDGDKYRRGNPPRQGLANLDRFDDACQFWVQLVSGRGKLKEALHDARRPMVDENKKKVYVPVFGEAGGREERLACIIHAWNLWIKKQPLTGAALTPEGSYQANEDGEWHLADKPVLSGIDVGDGRDREETEADEDANGDPPAPTPEELEIAKEAAKADREKPKEPAKKKGPVRKK